MILNHLLPADIPTLLAFVQLMLRVQTTIKLRFMTTDMLTAAHTGDLYVTYDAVVPQRAFQNKRLMCRCSHADVAYRTQTACTNFPSCEKFLHISKSYAIAINAKQRVNFSAFRKQKRAGLPPPFSDMRAYDYSIIVKSAAVSTGRVLISAICTAAPAPLPSASYQSLPVDC